MSTTETAPKLVKAAPRLVKRLLAEVVGTAALLMVITGSGRLAAALSPDIGLQVMAVAVATGALLFVIIVMFGPISGAQFNPVVTLAITLLSKERKWSEVGAFIAAQLIGAIAGTMIANLMFEPVAISWSTTTRSSMGLWLGEVVATVGLLLTIFLLARGGSGDKVPAAVGLYICSAIWFTSSTCFANPAVTVGRMFSESLTGIEPASVPGFIAAQLVGLVIAIIMIKYFTPDPD